MGYRSNIKNPTQRTTSVVSMKKDMQLIIDIKIKFILVSVTLTHVNIFQDILLSLGLI